MTRPSSNSVAFLWTPTVGEAILRSETDPVALGGSRPPGCSGMETSMRAPTAAASNAAVDPPRARGGGGLLDLVRLSPLMDLTAGSREVVVGLIDGPVAVDHPDFAKLSMRTLSERPAACSVRDASCVHGTFVAGILSARRGTVVPAVCPGCTLLLRPIFGGSRQSHDVPAATPEELAAAMHECIEGGAQILNVSAALTRSRGQEQRALVQVLDLAARRGVVVVVAAGNQRVITSSTLTRHPWVVSVVAYSRSGRPMASSTLGRSIGQRGLGAPGEDVTSLAPGGGRVQLGGSSTAAPFVAGAAALIRSEFPRVAGAEVRFALTTGVGRRRGGVVPPLLDAWSAYQTIAASQRR